MYQRVGKSAIKKNLKNIKSLCKELGNPHKNLHAIHIAGTNGKGTTSHILSTLFQQEGKKVGLYTSPHYKDFRERIKINGKLISRQKVIDFVHLYQSQLSHINASFFELTVALAFQTFNEEQTDIAIIETGLGGRLDSTNIILPQLSVITNISMDHTATLGDTIELIAGEKAGIIKRNIPSLIGEPCKPSMRVFKSVAKQKSSPLTIASKLVDIKLLQSHSSLNRYQIHFLKRNESMSIDTDLKGPFQQFNLVTSLAAYEVYYNSKGQSADLSNIKKALSNVKAISNYIGRWQIKRDSPLTIMDSAHNEAGVRYVVQQLSLYKTTSLHIVIGFVKDKNWQKLLDLFPNDARYYFCRADIPRGLDTNTLIVYANQTGKSGRTYSSVKNAERAALRRAQDDDIIFVGGSTFIVAELI